MSEEKPEYEATPKGRLRRKAGEAATDPLERAIGVAVEAHTGQREKAGAIYILHPLRVMLALDHPIERIAAVLHDVVEDTPWTLDDLRAAGIPEAAVLLVDRVTEREGEETKEEYYGRILEVPGAIRIKLADLNDNLDIRRLAEMPPKDTTRTNKYLGWRRGLMVALREQTG